MENITENGGILRVHYAPSRPVELMDFVKSCMAIASEYSDFAAARRASDCKLFVKEVRNGSIEIDLVSAAVVAGAVQQVLPIAEAVNIFSDFLGHLAVARDWLLGGARGPRPDEIGQKTFDNIRAFVEPVAKDGGASVTIQCVNVGGDANAPIVFGSQDANVAQNVVHRMESESQGQNLRRVEQTVLKWYQSRNSLNSAAGDKAIIESISRDPVRTVFVDRKLKALLLSMPENIFKSEWLVDVLVEFSDNRPRLYKVESIERLDA